MAGRRGHEVIPSARRLITSLRDMGYDFAQAVADVVDNSIEAKATQVDVDVEFDGDESWVRIVDNGHGMTPAELREAMRYGSEREYGAEDLGKFGLGLKTASMSQCRRLTVATRRGRERARIAAYSWDLEHIQETNRWEILPVRDEELAGRLGAPLVEHTGTVVLWQRLDRILGYKHPYGESARKRLFQMCRDIETHLAMVFHRFLAGRARGRRLRIRLNGNEVRPWDPFCQTENMTQKLDEIELPLEHEGVSGTVRMAPYILPAQDDFSSPDAFRAASGPANWNQQQGLYIYRADRMIQSGGWSRLRTVDEHTKLARVAVVFPPKLDEAFKINVAKMRVQLPQQIRRDMKTALAPFVRKAREVYDRKPQRPTPPPPVTNPGGGAGVVRENPGPGGSPGAEARLTVDEWCARALSVAEPGERAVIRSVSSRMRKADSSGAQK